MNDANKPRDWSRKWMLILLMLAIGVGMELAGKLSPGLIDLMKWLGGIYCGFNVTQKGVEWAANFVNKQRSPE